ncbi:hypothetical protein M6B22_07180 [Jatrophihabitans cynanchi]|uniref:Uncharacterized protein n=1 Tax=Jatrophihabitans cynanchi TaxID=2944128 RepID=A0ABY7K110_9ACTN|nr:hypothetical protein [Jatrophihabitans sp. SB3-54]WAX58539.1 hypothetical protein M6B22_07180 [Jatrophihabitans sp. SB3-54]
MSHATTVPEQHADIAAATTLACPGCRHADQLHAVELVEVLTPATFSLDQPKPAYMGDEAAGVTLADTQHWPADGAIVCRHCDRVDLRYSDLVPLIKLVDPAPLSSAAPTQRPTPGAQS